MLHINEQPVRALNPNNHHSGPISSQSSLSQMSPSSCFGLVEAVNLLSDQSHSEPSTQYETTSQQQGQQFEAPVQGLENPQLRHIDELLGQLNGPYLNAAHDLSQPSKLQQVLRNQRLMPVLFNVYCEMKERLRVFREDQLKQRQKYQQQLMQSATEQNEAKPEVQNAKLENLLIAEGITKPPPNSPTIPPLPFEGTVAERQDFFNKVNSIRKWYCWELDKYQNNFNMVKQSVVIVLKDQSVTRPIRAVEVDNTVKTIEDKFKEIQLQLKQHTCEALVILRSRFMDARRKRRNFGKQTYEILNYYFYSHLSNPYPSEETKEELAKQCGISISQVGNWFSNKRIRYKKTLDKESRMCKKPATDSAVQAYNSGMPIQQHPGAVSVPQSQPPSQSMMMGMMPQGPIAQNYSKHQCTSGQSYGIGYGGSMTTNLTHQ